MGYVEELRALVGHRPVILCGAVVIPLNAEGHILLQQRADSGAWGMPGGLMELGESTEQTARRELYEETGLTVGEMKLFNVYSGAEQFLVAPNGDELYVVTTVYVTNQVYGELQIDFKESLDFQYFHPDTIPSQIARTHIPILKDFLREYGASFYQTGRS